MNKLIKYSVYVLILSFALYQTKNIVLEIMTDGGEQVPIQKPDEAAAAEMGDLKAVMIGATGATGKYLFAELIKDKRFSRITTIGRRAASIPEDFEGAKEMNLEEEIQNGRLQQITSSEIDLNKEINKETVGKYMEGNDIFFSTFGTTKSTAGSADEFRRIDQGINIDMATVAKEMGVSYYGIMSSQGAKSNSWFLYLQVKGMIDDKASELGFDKVGIFRPGMLNRGQSLRFMEKVGSYLLHSIPVQVVAKAMIKDAVDRIKSDKEEDKGSKIYNNKDIYAFNGLGPNGK